MSNVPSRRRVAAALGAMAATCALSPSWVQAQGEAKRPVTLVVPFAPGGGTDQLARLLGAKLAEVLGNQVVVDNRTGASGTIGITHASKLPADGYGLVIGQADNLAAAPLLMRSVPYDPVKALEPIAHIANVPIVILTGVDQPYKTLQDIVKAGKADPNLLTLGSPGVGTTPHLSGELLGQVAGIRIRHVSYKGAAPAIGDVIAGRVTLMTSSIASVMPMIKAGKLRPLAVTSKQRSVALPDVPSVAEALGLADFDVGTWYGLFGPAGMPKDVVARLNQAMHKVVAMPDVKAHLEGNEGGAIMQTAPEALREQLERDIGKWSRVIKEAGITLD